MNKVIEFVNKFFELESQCYDLRRYPDIDSYNSCLDDLFLQVVPELKDSLGMLKLDKPKSTTYYKRKKNIKDSQVRHLFKFSQYTHENYGKVWVTYCSQANPNVNSLSTAFFIILNESEEFKVGKKYLYSNYSPDGLKYQWEEGQGLKDLNFRSLDGPAEIQRIQEPNDFSDGLKLYNQEI